MEDIRRFLNENQDPKAVEKAVEKLSELLTSNEVIEYVAVQKKPAVNLSPDSIALTNRRIVFCRPSNLGLSMNFQDFLWKDIEDCHIKEGLMGATFTVVTTKGTRSYVDYLPKAPTSASLCGGGVGEGDLRPSSCEATQVTATLKTCDRGEN